MFGGDPITPSSATINRQTISLPRRCSFPALRVRSRPIDLAQPASFVPRRRSAAPAASSGGSSDEICATAAIKLPRGPSPTIQRLQMRAQSKRRFMQKVSIVSHGRHLPRALLISRLLIKSRNTSGVTPRTFVSAGPLTDGGPSLSRARLAGRNQVFIGRYIKRTRLG